MRAVILSTLLALTVAVGAFAAPPVLQFSDPVRVNSYGTGYEPGIDVDSAGTLFITAHKASNVAEGQRLSSWLWYSDDNGATWGEMPSPLQSHDKLFAFEGDLAVDALDRLYYVDTYLVDNTISRWSPGPTWDYSVGIQRSTGLDDRPWLAAHGDGIVYYVGNNGAAIPALGTATEDSSLRTSRGTLYVSEDGGITWSLGKSLPFGGWCNVGASPVDDVTVFAVCIADGTNRRVVAQVSFDRGETWKQVSLDRLSGGYVGYPSVAFDRAGNGYIAWADAADGRGSVLKVARYIPAQGWTLLDATTHQGTIQRAWISAGSPGVVGIAFYATDDQTPSANSVWHAYASVSRNADAAAPTWEGSEVSAGHVTVGRESPGHLLQGVVAPDDAFHVTFARDVPAPDLAHIVDYNQDIYHTRQLS